MKSPKCWPELFPLTLVMSLSLTGEVSYLLGFFSWLFELCSLTCILPSPTARGRPRPGGSRVPLAAHPAWLAFGACHPFQGIISLLLTSVIATSVSWLLLQGTVVLVFLLASAFFCPDPLRSFDRQLDQKAFSTFCVWKGAWFDWVVSQMKNRRKYGNTKV